MVEPRLGNSVPTEQKPDVKPLTARVEPYKKKFTPDELRNAFMTVWQKLQGKDDTVSCGRQPHNTVSYSRW
jgi:hypothetical protein